MWIEARNPRRSYDYNYSLFLRSILDLNSLKLFSIITETSKISPVYGFQAVDLLTNLVNILTTSFSFNH